MTHPEHQGQLSFKVSKISFHKGHLSKYKKSVYILVRTDSQIYVMFVLMCVVFSTLVHCYIQYDQSFVSLRCMYVWLGVGALCDLLVSGERSKCSERDIKL